MSGFQASLLCRPSFSPYLPRLAPSLCPHRRVAVTPLFASFSIPYSRRRCLAFPPFRALSEKRDPNLYDVVSSSSPEETGREEQALISGDLGSVEKSSSAAQEKRFPVLVLFVGLWDFLKRGWSKLILSEWLNWWPFWRQEKRLERLIAEADANPKDCAKQSTLLAELNRHSPESVIRRFEQRDHAVDSRGVAEYLRALVVTNSIAEYLPDEQSGKPSSLPML